MATVRRRFISLIAAGLALLPAVGAQAVLDTGLTETANSSGLAQATGKPDVITIVAYFVNALIGFLGIIFLLLTIYAGFLWMTAQGDPKKVESAKAIIKNAIIGLIIVAGSYVITNEVFNAFFKANTVLK
ncbi:hypothetical protein A3C96_02570 [Candidatus Uhrbacteria bacterium RIFCSPHIGHO2_02_FULL_60_10]|uniref:TrbC/VIRB2 family protein n=1 Tax=Candidatus Uhrbacteria bacterium RIFCSPHIGHO2_02_FULL_60_10 TaxID=1802392 RepID=A0A1F7U2W6_9BACT|nr:MAG: hypothetical protein A3C96_02570 [Candidatus Uhrbacteria bacterium RIFCSPHIGHO2_02_FULL_60_10]